MKLSIPCKVCDRGSLDSKRICRMNGPAVVIGYILLIPSIAGIVICAAAFVSLLFPPSLRSSARQQAIAEMKSHGVRRHVIERVVDDPRYVPQKELTSDDGAEWVVDAQNTIINANIGSAPAPVMERAGERAAKIMEDAEIPSPIVLKVLSHPTLDADDEMQEDLSMVQIGAIQEAQGVMRSAALRSSEVNNGNPLFRIFGQTFFIFAAIGAFVSGLLGWLLVMKKRVLQCNFCNAVVEAG
jgi:hypothetical protein